LPAAAIIYGEASGIVRRLVVMDQPRDPSGRWTSITPYILRNHVGAGEAVLEIPPEEVLANGLPDAVAMDARVAEKRGKPADEGRCLVIDDKSGDVVDVVLADPAIDRIPGKTLYQHPKAQLAMVMDAETGDFVAAAEIEDREQARLEAAEAAKADVQETAVPE
jgi:hypothetical protein